MADQETGVLRRISAAAPRRIIFIGDIHGCYAEVSDLLALVGADRDDIVVSVGDLVRKGPDVVRVVELWRERGYLAVLGNNEEKILRASRNGGSTAAADAPLLARADLLEHLSAFPIVIDFPRERLTTVHGGLLPHMHVTEAQVETHRAALVKLRYIRRDGSNSWDVVQKGEERPGDRLWSQEWRGDRFVVYGHTPLVEPRFDDQALGLDTGCVYGRRLTAAVWTRRSWTMHSVKARRSYAE